MENKMPEIGIPRSRYELKLAFAMPMIKNSERNRYTEKKLVMIMI